MRLCQKFYKKQFSFYSGMSIELYKINITTNMKNNFKRVIYPLLVVLISASCSAPRYASAQNDDYYNNNNNQNNNNPNDQNNNENYSYDQNQGNLNDQEYNPNNYEEDPSEVNINSFNDALSPYGRWIQSPEYGRAWIAGISGFIPYSTGGHWLYSSYGWTWASDYAWGWAPFHYGRWAYDPFYGWMWVPGYEWGPAWVSWRTGGGYYGWSPLGPGLGIGIDVGIPYNRWVFAPCRYMGYDHINRYYVAPSRNITIIHNTTIINNTTVFNNRRFVAGPNRADVERFSGRRINTVQIENASAPGRTAISQNRVQMYRPGVRPRLQNNAQDNHDNLNRNNQLPQRNNDVNIQNQGQVNRNGQFRNDNRNQQNAQHPNNIQPSTDQRFKIDNNRGQQVQDNRNQFNQYQRQQQMQQQQMQQRQQQQMQQRQQEMQQQQMQQRQQQFRQEQRQQKEQENNHPPERQFNNDQFNNKRQDFNQQRQEPVSRQPQQSGGKPGGGHHF